MNYEVITKEEIKKMLDDETAIDLDYNLTGKLMAADIVAISKNKNEIDGILIHAHGDVFWASVDSPNVLKYFEQVSY